MKNEKRALRIEVMQTLYQYDLYHSEKITFIPEFETEEANVLFHKVVDVLDEIDDVIEDNLYRYSLARLSYLDRAIIRLATYELLMTDVAKNIIINEALELTKIYTDLDDQKQRKFNNKVLDQIATSLRG